MENKQLLCYGFTSANIYNSQSVVRKLTLFIRLSTYFSATKTSTFMLALRTDPLSFTSWIVTYSSWFGKQTT